MAPTGAFISRKADNMPTTASQSSRHDSEHITIISAVLWCR